MVQWFRRTREPRHPTSDSHDDTGYKSHYKDWVYLVPMVQSSLNHTAVPSLGNKAPVELFTGLPCPTPFREFYLPEAQALCEVPVSADIDMFLANPRCSIQDMHKVVEDRRLKQVDEKSGDKLLVTWVGPYHVVRDDVHSFRVQHLITGAELDVHASRLKFYADLNVTEELLEHISPHGDVLAVEKLKRHRWNRKINDYEVLVQWKDSSRLRTQYWQRVTMGGEQQQQEHAAVTPLLEKKPRSKKHNRSRQQQRQPAVNQDAPDRSPDNVQASNRGELAGAMQQTLLAQPGSEREQSDLTTTEGAAQDRRLRPSQHRRPQRARQELTARVVTGKQD
ncbi:hypothetical protein PHPALM_28208 [Phytophthora palmivora]|uniref:Chromo domain-containing protein n=1 Tax=Phytophthora palmivora TaxID=4796 RepID=A0A2P4XAN0_9STRA|nr:hypothetical protein PHPALM_28208 [Phytophthora palmivora]